MIPPVGQATYTRLLGVPFLRGKKQQHFEAGLVLQGAKSAVTVAGLEEMKGSYETEGGRVSQRAVTENKVSVQALALTLRETGRSLAAYETALSKERNSMLDQERIMTEGLQRITPAVEFLKAPLKPTRVPMEEQSVLFGRSSHMAPGKDIETVYAPMEDGGFRISNSSRQFNRLIAQGMNRLWTGDVPIFWMDMTANCTVGGTDRMFPLWPRPEIAAGGWGPSMGTLRIGVQDLSGKPPEWLDAVTAVTTTFRPGYTQYEIDASQGKWKAQLMIAPSRTSMDSFAG